MKPRSQLSFLPDLHVVALSGGKDSTALALRLAEVEPRDYTYIITPTGNEPDAMFAHWRKLGEMLGKPLTVVVKSTLITEINRQGALPNWQSRWCTRMLKIEPCAQWLAAHSPAVLYVGIRADEPLREGGDYAAVPDIETDFPFRRWGWGLCEVVDYNRHRGVTIPKRTDCKLCFFQRLIEWYEFWLTDPQGWAEGEALEKSTGHTFRSPGRDTWPASMKELRARFEQGDVPRDTRDALNEMKCRVCRL